MEMSTCYVFCYAYQVNAGVLKLIRKILLFLLFPFPILNIINKYDSQDSYTIPETFQKNTLEIAFLEMTLVELPMNIFYK